MNRLRFKAVFRRDPDARMIRLFRVMWETGTVGDGDGCSNSLTFALQPALFQLEREFGGWLLILAGLRIHRKRSFGGIFP